MSAEIITTECRQHAIELKLNRPEKHNALNPALTTGLQAELDNLRNRSDLRCLLLSGEGASFCAGADIGWMKASKDYSIQENREDARQLSQLLQTLESMPMPVVAKVRGVAYGGGAGLLACCDMVLAGQSSRFAFSEVRLGLVPAMISPYVLAAIGGRQARRYFLSGEQFGANIACRIGLVHEVCKDEELDEKCSKLLDNICANGPEAVQACKQMLRKQAMADRTQTENLVALISRIRTGDEAQEGLSAFLEKRKPDWPQ